GDTAVEVRLADREPTFVVLTAREDDGYEEPAQADGADPHGGTARLTVRRPDPLKTRIEAAAAHDGTSVNTWLVRVAGRALENPGRPGQTGGPRGPGLPR